MSLESRFSLRGLYEAFVDTSMPACTLDGCLAALDKLIWASVWMHKCVCVCVCVCVCGCVCVCLWDVYVPVLLPAELGGAPHGLARSEAVRQPHRSIAEISKDSEL